MPENYYSLLFVMAGVTYLVRMLPLAVLKRRLENRFVRSLLLYIPYAVLGAMTFPAIFYATGNVITSVIGTVIALVMAYFNLPLIVVALTSSAGAFIASLIIGGIS